MSGYRRLVANTLATLGGRVANVVIALVLSTLLFRWLGPARYGLWSFFFVFVSYSSLVDLGLATTLERSVARFRWQGDVRGIEDSLNLGLLAMASLSALLQILVWLLPPSFWERFELATEVRRLSAILPLCLLLNNASTVVGAGLAGIQRMGALNVARSAVNGARAVIVVALAGFGFRRLDFLLLVYSSGSLVAAVLCWRILEGRLGHLRLRIAVRRDLATEFFRFGGAVQATTLSSQAGDQLFRLVLGSRFGAGAMGFYDLGTRAAIVLRSFASVLLAVLVPFGTEEHLEAGTQGISRLHRLSLKYTALFVLCGTVIAFYFSRELVEVWLGKSAAVSSVVLIFRVFLAVHAIGALAGPSAMLGRAAGTPLPETASSILAMVLGLAAAVAARGFSMAVIVFAIALAGASLALWIILTKRLRLHEIGLRELAKVAGIALASLLTVVAVDHVLLRLNTGSVGRIALGSSAALATAAVLVWTSHVLSPSERDFWIGLASSGRRSGEIASSTDKRTSP